MANLSDTTTDTYDYDAFGNKINSTGTTPNNFLYRGEQYDSALGLYYLRARYMNPLTGRFMSRDPEVGEPTDPRTLHKYLYVGGDPVNLFDPTGRATYQKPGGAATEYLSLVSTAPIRVFLFTQYAIPSYIQSVGVFQFWGGVTGLAGLFAVEGCELAEFVDALKQASEASDSSGTTVGPGPTG